MTLLATALVAWFAAAAAETTPIVVQAPDSPVRLDHAKIFNVVAGEPAILMYAATNLTDNDLEQFTVIAYIFDPEGTLKARQVAPGRRTPQQSANHVTDDDRAAGAPRSTHRYRRDFANYLRHAAGGLDPLDRAGSVKRD